MNAYFVLLRILYFVIAYSVNFFSLPLSFYESHLIFNKCKAPYMFTCFAVSRLQSVQFCNAMRKNMREKFLGMKQILLLKATHTLLVSLEMSQSADGMHVFLTTTLQRKNENIQVDDCKFFKITFLCVLIIINFFILQRYMKYFVDDFFFSQRILLWAKCNFVCRVDRFPRYYKCYLLTLWYVTEKKIV